MIPDFIEMIMNIYGSGLFTGLIIITYIYIGYVHIAEYTLPRCPGFFVQRE